MDWKNVSKKFIQAGLPLLGTILGGPLGGVAGKAASALIASKLGCEEKELNPDMLANALSNSDMLVTLKELELSHKLEWEKLIMQDRKNQQQFILEYEGAAKDYKDIPFIGPIILLFRGLIRPMFTVAVGYWDWIYFTTALVWAPEKVKLLTAINLLVLVFWFGERAVKNSGIVQLLIGKSIK